MPNEDDRTSSASDQRGGTPGQGPVTPADADEQDRLIQRRRFLQAGIGVTVALTVTGLSALSVTGSLRPIAKVTPEQEPPEDGDLLVVAQDQGKQVSPADLSVGQEPIMAYPKNAKSGVVKSGTDNNLILLARMTAGDLGPDTAPHAAQGVVGYSGVCTHLCCTVSDWNNKTGVFVCPCHRSEFDPREDGKVLSGPAPRALPLLPLKLENGTLKVAGGFLTSVGCS